MSLAPVKRRISLAIKAKRRQEGSGLREAARKCGIDPSTLSRLERGAYSTLPDAPTLEKVAKWLGMTVSTLLAGENGTEIAENTLPEMVEVHLRADKSLAPATAKALADMFKALYEQATKTPK